MMKRLTVLAALLWAPIAQAGSLYVFGDSLADNGNIPRLYGIPFSIIEGSNGKYYDDGRFSNGPVWAEYLPGLTGLSFQTSNDHAVGGAFTGPLTFPNGTFDNLIQYKGLNLPLPSLAQEIAGFAAAGGRFSRDDVAGIWIGANDDFTAAAPADPADNGAYINTFTGIVVGQERADLDALIGLGARTLIVQNVPMIGRTPSYNTGTLASIDFINGLVAEQDSRLNLAVAALHRQTGANILLMNEALALNELIANPAAYDITNVTDACVDTPSCRDAPQAQQDKYLFWDDVHPTTHTHEIIAEYTADAYNGYRSDAVPAQLAALGGQAFATALNRRLGDLRNGLDDVTVDLSGAQGSLAAHGGWSGFLTGAYDFGARKTNYAFNGFSYNTGTVTGGLDYRFGRGVVAGAAFGYSTEHANIEYGGHDDIAAYQIGLYAGLVQPLYYANLVLRTGFDEGHTRQPGVLDQITASPNGNEYGFDVNAGYTPSLRGVTMGPVAGFSFSKTTLDSYTESGDAVLTQAVGNQNFSSNILDAGVAAATTVTVGHTIIAPQIRAVVDDLVSGNGGQFATSFTDEPGVYLDNTYASTARYWGDISAEIAASITPRLSVAARFETTVAKSDGDDHEASIGIKYVF